MGQEGTSLIKKKTGEPNDPPVQNTLWRVELTVQRELNACWRYFLKYCANWLMEMVYTP